MSETEEYPDNWDFGDQWEWEDNWDFGNQWKSECEQQAMLKWEG